MTPLQWTWTAIVADVGLLLSTQIRSTAQADFWQVLVAHTVICCVVAAATYVMLPRRFHKPRWAVAGLMFCFAFMAPVVGAVGLLLLTRTNLHLIPLGLNFAMPVPVELPVYDVQSLDQHRGGQGAIRSRLGKAVPGLLRMQSLLTLQAVPSKVSNPILEELLGDDTDDVRLVAFGMLDTEEKKISSQIRRESDRLQQTLNTEQRFDCLRQLAELHWEMVYACLAQGELRQHILAEAERYANEALSTATLAGSGLIFLRGRIWLEQGKLAAAQQAFEQAVALGQPKTSVWPYLAEIAYRQREFQAVHAYMVQLTELNLASRTRAVEDFWVRHGQGIHLSDYNHLPHI